MPVAVTLTVMFRLSWQITAAALLLLPLFLLPARVMGGRLTALMRQTAACHSSLTALMTERFSAPGAGLVKLFADPEAESTGFTARATRIKELEVRSTVSQFLFVIALALVSALAVALVYGLGGYLAVTGTIRAGTVVTLALLLRELYDPLTRLAGTRLDLITALVGFERILEVLDLPPLVTEPAHPKQLPAGPLPVEFDEVTFAYPAPDQVSLASLEDAATLDTRGGEDVLRKVSFRIEPGTLTALVGPSGAGKSTLATLIPRLYDTDHGSVRIGGADVRDLSFATLRRTVGMVTQDSHLFHDTVRANLTLADPEATDEDLWHALRRARVDGLVRSLPEGLDTVVGERGHRLSGGERQRLTIARVLLARPRVVILDEATAHLDAHAEAAVQEALTEALQGRTALVIAHRLATVRAADRILVLEAGELVESGTHDALLAADGAYARLYRTQFAEPADIGGAVSVPAPPHRTPDAALTRP
ncbi:hypothetical protein GCM10010302_67290 [Streptomyces polychromogenes]|uniref:ABC transporter n=1 Tax=Streptomyces polychromogenes TaxID=67342 RepID=A0ABP3FIF0_9ACTN